MKNLRTILTSPIGLFSVIFGWMLMACGENFLDVKQDQSITTPHLLSDFQGLLDNGQSMMNNYSCHSLGIIGSDEYNLTDGNPASISIPLERNAYVWATNVYEERPVDDWDKAYGRILIANVVLEGVAKNTPDPADQEVWQNIRGSALFFRALNFYQLAQLFCKPYEAGKTEGELGIPLRLESDVTAKSVRSTIGETYHQIISDLTEASELLAITQEHPFRPSKSAAFALLAKTYLLMADYEQAAANASASLALNDSLVDFNESDPSERYLFHADFGMSHPEVLFFCYSTLPLIVRESRMSIDPGLLSAFQANDLRKQLFFREYREGTGNIIFKGSYTGGPNVMFTGLAVDEVLLIRAECNARLGRVEEARKDINQLLVHRIRSDAFSPIETENADELIAIVVNERRKELIFRGVRWEDLRRLNREERFAKTLVRRTVDGSEYTLPPGDKRYVWPIPDNVLELSGIPQNDR